MNNYVVKNIYDDNLNYIEKKEIINNIIYEIICNQEIVDKYE